MNWQSVLVLILIVNGAGPQTVDSRKWNRVEVLCGMLIHSEDIPEKGAANTFTEKTKPIKRAIVRLYLRTEDAACCDKQQPAAEIATSRDGRFEFKGMVPGPYWFVAKIDSKDYKLAITYSPDKKADMDCSHTLYALKKDQIQLEKVIVVD
jgi:hypothetical protein